jgi:type II secretory pathway component PulJ
MKHHQSHGYTLTDILVACGLMAAAATLVYPFLREDT